MVLASANTTHFPLNSKPKLQAPNNRKSGYQYCRNTIPLEGSYDNTQGHMVKNDVLWMCLDPWNIHAKHIHCVFHLSKVTGKFQVCKQADIQTGTDWPETKCHSHLIWTMILQLVSCHIQLLVTQENRSFVLKPFTSNISSILPQPCLLYVFNLSLYSDK